MKKIHFLITGLCFFGTVIHAQIAIDLKGGFSINSLSKPNFRSSAVIEPRPGWTAGAALPLIQWRHITLNTGVEILEKNYLWRRTGAYSGVYEAHRNTYGAIPVSLQATLAQLKRLKILVSSGAAYAYWVARRIDGVTPNAFDTSTTISPEGEVVQNFYLTSYSIKNDLNSSCHKRHELSVFAGLLIKYENSGRITPTLNINYNRGLTPLTQDHFSNLFRNTNSTLIVCGGAVIKLDR